MIINFMNQNCEHLLILIYAFVIYKTLNRVIHTSEPDLGVFPKTQGSEPPPQTPKILIQNTTGKRRIKEIKKYMKISTI